MLRILLADADSECVKNFGSYINTSFPDFKIVGNVRSPLDFALELDLLRPDLVVADMSLLGANAQQLIREAYEAHPDTRFILCGSYNDAEHMESIISFGVIDRMYKPVKPTELERSLSRAAKTFAEKENLQLEKERFTEKYKKNIELFKDKFLSTLIQGGLTDDLEITNSFKYFNIDLKPDYTVFIIKIENFTSLLQEIDEVEKHMLIYKISDIVNEKLRKSSKLSGSAIINRFNSIAAIVGGSEILPKMLEFCGEIKTDIALKCRVDVSITVGKTYRRAADISVSYKEAEAAARYRHHLGQNSVIPLQYAEPLNNITYRYPIGKEDALVYSAVAGEYEYCKTLIQQLMDALAESGSLPPKLLSKIVLDIIVSINRFTDEQHIVLVQDNPFNAFFPSKDILDINTIKDAEDYLNKTLKKYCAYMNELRRRNRLDILEKAKIIIEERYYENLNPAEIAVRLETTGEFLGGIFRENEKKSVYEYILSVRMRNAKRLMRETSFDDESIAVKVGYPDVKYFRSAFKQIEGVFTHEYRGRVSVTRRIE